MFILKIYCQKAPVQQVTYSDALVKYMPFIYDYLSTLSSDIKRNQLRAPEKILRALLLAETFHMKLLTSMTENLIVESKGTSFNLCFCHTRVHNGHSRKTCLPQLID